MRFVLEILRILLLIVIVGGFMWALIENVYTINETTNAYSWLAALAILLLFFVFYRNKLQFSGWYKGSRRAKLSKSIKISLSSISIVLLILPFLIGMV